MKRGDLNLTVCVVRPRPGRDGLDRVEHLLHKLRRLLKHNFVVKLGNEALFGVDDGRWGNGDTFGVEDLGSVRRWWLEQLENVIEGDGSKIIQNLLNEVFVSLKAVTHL